MESTIVQENGSTFEPRKYQDEMLRLSMEQNIIVAMDTGSGKTAIAILRIREELERCARGKTIWFMCPTVALAEQQCLVVQQSLPAFPSRTLTSKDDVDTWRTSEIWDTALHEIVIIVCTHQVLLDALSHGFVHMSNIALLVFDEAHHCTGDHAANRILQTFYHPLKREKAGDVPYIIGLTASPVTKTKVNTLSTIEANLDAISRTPKIHRDELMMHVHRPEMATTSYYLEENAASPMLLELSRTYQAMDIRKDPYVISLAAENSPLYMKTLLNQKTYSRAQMAQFVKEAYRVHVELGSWASSKLITTCARKYLHTRRNTADLLEGTDQEKQYICSLVASFDIEQPNDVAPLTLDRISHKVAVLVDVLVKNMTSSSAGIVFVTRRADVALLSMILGTHPATRDLLRVGTFIGTSEFSGRSGTVARMIEMKNEESTLDDLRTGVKNLIICTSVCEEGIDISACNFVICFDPPPNLKSFIQRRGRARHERSRFTLMLRSDGTVSANILGEWLSLEKRMEEQYMDDMRQLEVLKELECEAEEYREFKIQSTGATLTLHNAVQHLFHFCHKLPQAAYTILVPTFSYETDDGEIIVKQGRDDGASTWFACRVVLPNAIDASIRETRSRKTWQSERLARKDAAFEAYVKLYNAGLVNVNLLPSPHVDEDIEEAYAKIAKRPSQADVHGQYNPWTEVAAAWTTTSKVYHYAITLGNLDDESSVMRLVSPFPLPVLSTFTLYINISTSCEVRFSEPLDFEKNTEEITMANLVTKLLLRSIYPTKMSDHQTGFPLLFLPSACDNVSWLNEMTTTYPARNLLLKESLNDIRSIGLIRETRKYGRPCVFLGIDWRSDEGNSPADGTKNSKQYLQCMPLPKRRDFLHPIPNDQAAPSENVVFLDPDLCVVDCLPFSLARLALFIPSIMHKISTSLIAAHICQTILAPVDFKSPCNVLPALSTASAQEGSDYQRLEFLGDSILKTLTSISLAADHPQWHEGYLSNHKDRIVSNGRLAVAAQETGIDRYILTTAFTGQKWKPMYNEVLLSQHETPRRQLSTKTLADVVEALLGVAYLDGGFPKALRLLQIFIPEVTWRPLQSYSSSLLSHAAPALPISTYTHLTNLETLLDYTFTHKTLLLEALTHPSYPSTSLTQTPSYQRLEFLGDALLDYIVVTSCIYPHNHPQPLPLHKMHLLRTAAVNASFLAFRALATTHVLPTATTTLPLTLLSFLRAAPSQDLSTALTSIRSRFKTLSPHIHAALASPATTPYPWRLLSAFTPEKVVSDLVEAVVAAVYIDSGGNFGACEALLRRFGILGFVEGRTAVGAGGLWHPKEEVGMLAGERRVRYEVSVDEGGEVGKGEEKAGVIPSSGGRDSITTPLGQGKLTCRLLVGGEPLCTVRGWNRLEVETAAAEEGVRLLRGVVGVGG